jgi:hypothetical protein
MTMKNLPRQEDCCKTSPHGIEVDIFPSFGGNAHIVRCGFSTLQHGFSSPMLPRHLFLDAEALPCNFTCSILSPLHVSAPCRSFAACFKSIIFANLSARRGRKLSCDSNTERASGARLI